MSEHNTSSPTPEARRRRSYTVAVRVSILEYFEVEAATSEEALQNWRYGQFLDCGDTYLDVEPLEAEENHGCFE